MNDHLADDAPDPRDMLEIFTEVEPMSRFLVHLGYPEVEVKTVLRREFPGEDIDAAYDDAVDHFKSCQAEVAEIIARDDERARNAEHDLSKTMHQEGNDG